MARSNGWTALALFCFLLVPAVSEATFIKPDPDFTPGYLCSRDDPDYDRLYYPEKIVRCKRRVTPSMKKKIAEFYKVDQKDWAKYEFDHLIPLCAGGSNDLRNVFPQPQEEADKKDVIEIKVCSAMRAGKMTQVEAVRAIRDFFAKQGIAIFPEVE